MITQFNFQFNLLRREGRGSQVVLHGQLLVGPDGSHHGGLRGQGPSHLGRPGGTTSPLIRSDQINICFQIIGGFCALIGVFILALPVPIVVNRYQHSGVYQNIKHSVAKYPNYKYLLLSNRHVLSLKLWIKVKFSHYI